MSEIQYRRREPQRRARVRVGLNKTKLLVAMLCVALIVLLIVLLASLAGGGGHGEAVEPGEKIEFSLGSLGKIWIPALAGLEKNPYAPEDFYQDGNYINYKGSHSYRGVDVSGHDEDIDWAAVAADGVEFAMIRVGFRGYGNGEIVADEYFRQNIEGARAAGLKVGVYFFSQAITVEEALAEADMTLEAIAGYELQYPVVFDWETVGATTARTNDITPAMLNDCAVAFCQRVAEAGYQPMVYAGQLLALVKYDLSRLADYDLWLAEYDTQPDFYYNFQIWQYSEKGKVNGIPGNADLNLCFVRY